MICTKVVIIRGLFSLFAEYFRRIADLFAEFALFVFSSIFILIPHCVIQSNAKDLITSTKVIIHPTIKQFFRFLNGLLD